MENVCEIYRLALSLNLSTFRHITAYISYYCANSEYVKHAYVNSLAD